MPGADACGSVTLAVDHEHDEFVQRGPVSVFGDPNQRRNMDATGLVGEYRVDTRALQLHARVENVLDDRQQEVLGYRVPGIGAYAGLRFAFDGP